MVTESQMMLRLFLAAVLGGVIGFERELNEKAAGFRTHILVSTGSCLIMITSMHLFDIYQGIANVDPTRMAAHVISGIGFLGAGTIIRSRASVLGLTTAASLWSTAGLGVGVGCGLYSVCIGATFLILLSLTTLNKFLDKTIYRYKKIKE